MLLKKIVEENDVILEKGHYQAPSGRRVDLKEGIKASLEGSLLYPADLLRSFLDGFQERPPENDSTFVEVVAESSVAGVCRLAPSCTSLAVLNFASGRHPGGGYQEGAKAQEEDLARCSVLYPALVSHPGYYTANRTASAMYQDNMILTPEVPFFRNDVYDLLDFPCYASVITAPAPNLNALSSQEGFSEGVLSQVELRLRQRAGMVFALARMAGMRTLILGAWGCGVFGNDPAIVANIFAEWLESPWFAGSFKHVSFSVLDNSHDQGTLGAFRDRLQPK